MFRKVLGMSRDHQWNRYAGLRVVLALGSIISMLLASGADSYWR